MLTFSHFVEAAFLNCKIKVKHATLSCPSFAFLHFDTSLISELATA